MSLTPTAAKGWNSSLATLWLVSALTLLLVGFFVSGGHLNIDEGVYHLMVRDYATTGEFRLWTGYEEFQTAELTWPIVVDRNGQLFSQYPQLYTILAAPLFALMGYKALFLINALASVGSLWLTVWLARFLFPDRPIAAGAGLIFVFATFSWDYAFASMPHALSVFCVLAAFAVAAQAHSRLEDARSFPLAMAAGLIAGLSVGIRLDAIFVLPALVVPFLFRTPWRPFHALAAVAGALPGLMAVAAINHEKFGSFNPFTYGRESAGNASSVLPYLTIAAFGAIVLAGLWIFTRPRFRPLVSANRRSLSSLLIPQVSALLLRLLDGVFQLLVDFRIRDLGIEEGGLSRGPSGGMVYMGSLKKSLLQSCPYLAALAIPIYALFRNRKHRPAIALLFLVPLTYVAVYGYFAWHGGLGLNLRYFLPILPFTSILTAYALHDVMEDLPPDWRRSLRWVGLVLIAVYAVALFPKQLEISQQETIYLSFPLLLAGTLLVLALLHATGLYPNAQAVRKLAALGLCVTIVWSGLAAFAYDLPRSYGRRFARDQFTQAVTPHIEPDSIVFSAPNGLFYGQFDRADVHIATPHRDDFHDFEPLLRFHLEAGQPVYVWLGAQPRPWLQTELEQRGIWGRLEADPVFEHELGRLFRVSRLRPEPS
jgi:hypothetical protein